LAHRGFGSPPAAHGERPAARLASLGPFEIGSNCFGLTVWRVITHRD
jgi:hypothetical protein